MNNDENDKIRILYCTDMHLAVKNIRNKRDALKESISILDKVIDIIKKENINIFIQGGDLFDRGNEYEYIDYINEIEKRLVEINKLTDDNFYMVMGNHEYSYARNNPTFKYLNTLDDYCIQDFKTLETLHPTNKVIKIVNYLIIDNVEIHFKHYNRVKNYKVEDIDINSKNRLRIGLYHDNITTYEIMKSEKYLKQIESKGKVISSTDTDIFQNVDLAILAHIHTPMQPSRVNNMHNTLVLCPGSVKQNSASDTHEEVYLPIIEITSNQQNNTQINQQNQNNTQNLIQIQNIQPQQSYAEQVNSLLNFNNFNNVKLNLVNFKLENYADTFIQENIEKDRNKRIFIRENINNKILAGSTDDLLDLEEIFDDQVTKQYYRESDNLIMPNSYKLWLEYYGKE